MLLDQRQVQIVNDLYNQNTALANGTDDERRELTRMIDEQMAFEYGSRWGMKARAGGNMGNASKDSIGYLEDDKTVSAWDWQNGATRKPQVRAGQPPDYPHLPTDQAAFIAVTPVNHLGVIPQPNPEPPSDVQQELDDINHRLDVIIAQNNAMNSKIDNQAEVLAQMLDMLQILITKPAPEITHPAYVGRLGMSMRFTPEEAKK